MLPQIVPVLVSVFVFSICNGGTSIRISISLTIRIFNYTNEYSLDPKS